MQVVGPDQMGSVTTKASKKLSNLSRFFLAKKNVRRRVTSSEVFVVPVEGMGLASLGRPGGTRLILTKLKLLHKT